MHHSGTFRPMNLPKLRDHDYRQKGGHFITLSSGMRPISSVIGTTLPVILASVPKTNTIFHTKTAVKRLRFSFTKKKNHLPKRQVVSGADYEARTRYLHLGKVALYQMS